ncbi:MAG: DUF5610 domain-containing protein [Fibrobacterota bacterium]
MVGTIYNAKNSSLQYLKKNQNTKEGSGSATTAKGLSYSSDSIQLSYKGANGSTYEVRMMQESLKKAGYSTADAGGFSDLFGKTGKEFQGQAYQSRSYRLEIEIVYSQKGTSQQNDTSVDDLIGKLPDEWKPDAVADRILGFVKGFQGKTNAKGEDFFTLAKDAVMKGVKAALKELENLPDSVLGVSKKTSELILEKLDSWGKEEGIHPGDASNETDNKTDAGIDFTA